MADAVVKVGRDSRGSIRAIRQIRAEHSNERPHCMSRIRSVSGVFSVLVGIRESHQ